MNIKEKKLENAGMELEIEVPVERVNIEYKSVFDKLKRTVKIDGFRKGKAPEQLIEQRYMEYADQEVAENLLKTAFLDAVTEKQITPIAEPRYDFDKIQRGESFLFKAVFDTPPTVELGKYKEIAAEERTCSINEKDVGSEMETLREQHAVVTKKEDPDAEVEKGDLVNLLMKRVDDINDSVKDDVEFKEYPIVVGRVKEDSILDDQLVGMKSNEEKQISVKYPKNYYIKELAGQKATYMVRIKQINDRKLPELDDDFAKKIGYESVEEFKNKTLEFMENFIKEKSSGESKNHVLKSIIENSTFEIPETLILSEMSDLFQRMQQRFGGSFETIDEFARAMGINADEFSARLREEAMYTIKKSLILYEVARKEELKVTDEMFNDFVKSYAERSKMKEEDVQKIIEENRSRENVEHELLLNTAIDFLYDNAKIKKKKPVSFEEFVKENSDN